MIRAFPAFSHPTTLVFVDDDTFLLESMNDFLQNKSLIRKFSGGEDAVPFIHERQQQAAGQSCLDRAIQYTETSSGSNQPISVNLSAIAAHLRNAARFETIAVIIVDFAMPNMTGVEFLEKIGEVDCKKLMLTGEADSIDGLNCFNLNLVDRICRKSEPVGVVTAIIEEMQLRYFQDQTQLLLNTLQTLRLRIPACLQDAKLTPAVLEMFNAKDIVEHYLINENGFFITATRQGALKLFTLQSESERKSSGNGGNAEQFQGSTGTFYGEFLDVPDEQGASLKELVSFDQIQR